MPNHRIHGLLGLGGVWLIAGFTTPLPAGAATHRSHHSTRHGGRHHSASMRHVNGGIPQHNGGDRDADNNGVPSDGDGNI